MGAPLERDDAGTADFQDLVVAHEVDEVVDPAAGADQSQYDGITGVVHDLGAKGARGVEDIVTVLVRRVGHLHQQKLAVDGGLAVKLVDGLDVRELQELALELTFGVIVPVEEDRDAGELARLGLAHRQAHDVELTATEEARDPIEHTGLVLYEDCEGVTLHAYHLDPFHDVLERAVRLHHR